MSGAGGCEGGRGNRSTRPNESACFCGESISRRHMRGCLRTCAYIDIDSGASRAPRARLIFITSFPLGNSKHILITFFTGRSTSTPQKRAATERRASAFPLRLRISTMEYSVRPLTSRSLSSFSLSLLLRQSFLGRVSSSRKSRPRSGIQLLRSRALRDESKSAASRRIASRFRLFLQRDILAERNRDDHMHPRKRSSPVVLLPCPLSSFLHPGTVKIVSRAHYVSVTVSSRRRREYFSQFASSFTWIRIHSAPLPAIFLSSRRVAAFAEVITVPK